VDVLLIRCREALAGSHRQASIKASTSARYTRIVLLLLQNELSIQLATIQALREALLAISTEIGSLLTTKPLASGNKRDLATGYGRLTRSEKRSRMHPVLLQKVHEGAQSKRQVLTCPPTITDLPPGFVNRICQFPTSTAAVRTAAKCQEPTFPD
jgi:hypothetical protein